MEEISMKWFTTAILSFSFMLNCLSARADTIKLRDGRAVQGTFLGGNTRQIDFITQAGKMESYPIQSVVGLSFSASSVSPSGGGSTAAQSAPAVAPRPPVI